MKNLRKYGTHPYKIAVLHGGPGAAGEMAPVARELSNDQGILEPLQTADTINQQVDELKSVLISNDEQPVIVIGWSWGAWLGLIFTATYPKLVEKLIIIGAGPIEEKYSQNIMITRLSRLNDKYRKELISLLKMLAKPRFKENNKLMARFGKLISIADSYRPLPHDDQEINYQHTIFQKVSTEASELRRNGKLIKLIKDIQCPVVAIHGDYDPHPYIGVKEPLTQVIPDFRFYLLNNCGHKPWFEKEAKEKFYEILKNELK